MQHLMHFITDFFYAPPQKTSKNYASFYHLSVESSLSLMIGSRHPDIVSSPPYDKSYLYYSPEKTEKIRQKSVFIQHIEKY